MIRKSLAICFCLLIGFGRVQAELRPFLESWNNIAYYDTNIERKGFSSLLARFEGKLGIFLFNTPLQIYGAYYGVGSQSGDYWNNAVYYGPGLRLKPLVRYPGTGWYNEWLCDVKVFAELLSSTFLKNAASGEANRRTDSRCGLDLWHEWNLDNPDLNNFWGELWANYSVRSTNFSWTDFNGYIFYFQPKIGRHLGKGVEPYLRADLTMSDKADYWLNVADYGVGLRFEPWKEKFKMFAEFLTVSYLKDKPTDPNKNVTSDVRFGVDFSYGR